MPDHCRDTRRRLNTTSAKPMNHKPSNWWAREKEPWKRISAEIAEAEAAEADSRRPAPADDYE